MPKQIPALFLIYAVALSAQQDAGPSPPANGGTNAPLHTAADLQQLVAPIALYPDALVAQILAASTYPTEVVEADRWLEQHSKLKGDDLAKGVDKESWDPSVKALTQFPSVLANLDKNLAWTSSLGEAYTDQQQDVLDAVQTMRQRAQAAGNLKSTDQQTVTNNGQAIQVAPANPAVVYVPTYDPWLVYGAPVPVWGGWYPYPGLYIDGPGIGFNLGFGVGLFAGFGWGWNSWGFDWRGRGILYNHGPWFSHSRAFVNRGGFGRGFAPPRAAVSRGPVESRGVSGMRSGAFSGFNHGGITRSNSFRGAGGFGGGFHGGGFHGGGGRR